MVLAAGLGIRMRPLTALAPKPALPVLNRPLIAHALEHLVAHGVSLAVINSHHMSERIEEAVMGSRPDQLEVRFSNESAILGTAGGLKRAAKHFQGEPFYLVNSDSLTDADLTAAAAAHAASGRAATLIVMSHDPASEYRPVAVAASGGPNGRVVGIAGRRWGREDAVQRTFTGVHVLNPSVLEEIPPATACDINADIYPWLLDQDPDSVGTWLHEGWWFEAGGPARYLDLNLEMLARSGRDSVVGPGYRVDPLARVARSVIGSRVRLARGAQVEGCVLWDDVTVGEGVTLERCIVTHGVEVPMIPLASTILLREKGGRVLMHPMGAPE
jgi:NDP-sugar pyrophosphorylase family protein